MYSFGNSYLPPKFDTLFPLNNRSHSYNARHAISFRLPYCVYMVGT